MKDTDLKSTLTFGPENEAITFKADELLDIVASIFNKYKNYEMDIEEIDSTNQPRKLSTPSQWLTTGLQLKTGKKTSYFQIGNRLIKYRHEDRYVADWGNIDLNINDDDLRFIFNKKPNQGLPDWVIWGKEKFAFILYFISKEKLQQILNSKKLFFKSSEAICSKKTTEKSIINKIIEFIHEIYYLSRSCGSKEQLTLLSSCDTLTLEFKLKPLFENVSIPEFEPISEFENSTNKDVIKSKRVIFPFSISKEKANDFIDKFFNETNKPSSLKLLTFINYSPTRSKGPSYPAIHEHFSVYFNWTCAWYELIGYPIADSGTNILITQAVRQILNGSFNNSIGEYLVKEAFADYLSIITASFFISETGRNPVSFLSGLILLDLIEFYNLRRIYSARSNKPARKLANHFSWQNFFWSENNKHIDIYGNEVSSEKWGGIHPMAHDGSFQDEFQNDRFKINQPLTITRQKELDLVIRWLELKFESSHELKQILDRPVTPEQKKENIVEIIKDSLSQRLSDFNFAFTKDISDLRFRYRLFSTIRTASKEDLNKHHTDIDINLNCK